MDYASLKQYMYDYKVPTGLLCYISYATLSGVNGEIAMLLALSSYLVY